MSINIDKIDTNKVDVKKLGEKEYRRLSVFDNNKIKNQETNRDYTVNKPSGP